MARDEAGAADEVRRADGARSEPEMAHRHRARLLGVVDEVALRRVPRGVADDLDAVLVGADRAVRAEAVEHGAHHLGVLGVEGRIEVEREVGDAVPDAEGEVVARPGLAELVVHGLDHGRRELLGREAVAAAHDPRHGAAGLGERGEHVEVQRLAERARLLGAVEHGQGPDRLRQRRHEVLRREGPIKADLDEAHLLAGPHEVQGGLVRRFAPRAHHDDDALGVRRTHVVEEPVAAPDEAERPRPVLTALGVRAQDRGHGTGHDHA